MSIPLTIKEARLLQFIKDKIEETGAAPSLREISSGCGFNSAANSHLMIRNLEAKKYLKRIPGKHRGVSVLPQGAVVTLNPEIYRLVSEYAASHGILKDVAACELLRGALGAT